MQNELNALEGKLALLLQLSRHLRTENMRLRQELATALSHDRQTTDKMTGARVRLEHLLAQIPDKEA